MPRIKVHSAQIAPSGRLNVQRRTAEDFGAGAITAFANAATNVVGALEAKAEKDANMWVDQALADYRLRQTERLTELEQSAELGAPNFTSGYKAEIEGQRDTMLAYEGLTPTAKARLQQGLTQANTHFIGRAVNFESQSRGQKQKIDWQTAGDKRADTLLQDPSQYQALYEEAVAASETAFPGMDAVQRSELIKPELDKLGLASFNGALNAAQTPASASALLDSLRQEGSPWSERLTTEAYTRAVAAAESNVTRVETVLRQEQARAETAATTALLNRGLNLQLQVENGTVRPGDIADYEADILALSPGAVQNSGIRALMSIHGTARRVASVTSPEKELNAVNIAAAVSDARVAGDEDVLLALRAHADMQYEDGKLDAKSWLSAVTATNTALAPFDTASDDLKNNLLIAVSDAALVGDVDVIDAVRATAEQAHEDGELTTQELKQVAMATNSQLTSELKRRNEVGFVQASIANGTTLDMQSKDHRAAVDTAYKEIIKSEEFNSLSATDKELAIRDYVRSIGIVPETLISDVRSGLASTDPAVVVASANRLVAIRGLSPAFAAEHPGLQTGQIEYAEEIQRMVQLTGDSQTAIDMIQQERAMLGSNPELKKRHIADYRQQIKDKSAKKASDFLEGLGDDAMLTQEVETHMNTLAAEIYATMAAKDVDVARERAVSIMKQSWSKTQVGAGASGGFTRERKLTGGEAFSGTADRLMYKPPEIEYARYNDPDRDAKWMNEQLWDDMQSNAPQFKHLNLPDNFSESVQLVVHPTITGPTGKATYMRIAKDKQGSFVVLPGNWYPDFKLSRTGIAEAQRTLSEINRVKSEAARKREMFAQGREDAAKRRRMLEDRGAMAVRTRPGDRK